LGGKKQEGNLKRGKEDRTLISERPRVPKKGTKKHTKKRKFGKKKGKLKRQQKMPG